MRGAVVRWCGVRCGAVRGAVRCGMVLVVAVRHAAAAVVAEVCGRSYSCGTAQCGRQAGMQMAARASW